MPENIDVNKILEAISIEKDVAGFHLYNLGALVVGNTVFPPCTPYGVLCLLEHIDIPIEGQNAVIVGRSNIVGKPMALMVKPGATVIDVGINRLDDGRLVEDVDFEGVKEVAGHITPVPGGVGPMTITMLVANTIMAAERA